MTLATLLLIAALVCFILSACNVPRANWLAIGLAFWVSSILFGGVNLLR